jgi:2'-5' RNA ligase
MPESLRLFFGFALSEHDRAIVARVQEGLRRDLSSRSGSVRWLSADDFHLTLRFVGRVPTSALHDYELALERALSRLAPLAVYVDRLLGFPDARRARTLVLGCRDPGERLRSMAARLEQELAPLGLVADARPLVPHVTLARIAPPLDLSKCVDACAHHDSEIMLSRVCLFESRAGHETARYVPLSELHLCAPAPSDGA